MHTSTDSNIDSATAQIVSVLPGSAAAAAGLLPGDRVLSLGGRRLRDVIDYQFYLEPGIQEVEVERRGVRLTFQLDYDEFSDPGIRFAAALFDGVRGCRNHCGFCFVDQLPAGLRAPLYQKDDDYRLSFLHGNFITLNYLTAADLDRLRDQRLSPLYVSVHATAPVIRAHMMGCSRLAASDGLDALRELGKAGITLHAQIVLCPGINDGQVLKSTVGDLAAEFPGIASIGVVPVALAGSGKQAAFGRSSNGRLKPVGEEASRKVVEAVARWQDRFRAERGAGLVHAADEFYLKAGLPLPDVDAYDGFPQYENGIGIATAFIDGLTRMGEDLYRQGLPAGTVYLLSGELAAPVVEFACGKLTRATGGRFRPLVVKNSLFGPHVTVTGLLSGHDVLAAARRGQPGPAGSPAGAAGEPLNPGNHGPGHSRGPADNRPGPGDLLLIPANCLESSGERFLDDMTLSELEAALGFRVGVI